MSADAATKLRRVAAGREISPHNRDAGWNLQRPERKPLLIRGSLELNIPSYRMEQAKKDSGLGARW